MKKSAFRQVGASLHHGVEESSTNLGLGLAQAAGITQFWKKLLDLRLLLRLNTVGQLSPSIG
jgi:hypothetical protein